MQTPCWTLLCLGGPAPIPSSSICCVRVPYYPLPLSKIKGRPSWDLVLEYPTVDIMFEWQPPPGRRSKMAIFGHLNGKILVPAGARPRLSGHRRPLNHHIFNACCWIIWPRGHERQKRIVCRFGPVWPENASSTLPPLRNPRGRSTIRNQPKLLCVF